jgi:hypothetical protein
MVIVLVAEAVPHPLVNVYFTVSIPAVTPVTMPDVPIVAVLLLLLQVPPVTLSVNVVAELTHKDELPVIVPALGSGLMVMVLVAVVVPHPLVKV